MNLFASASYSGEAAKPASAQAMFEMVAGQAAALARKPYQTPSPLPPNLCGLDYDDYRLIAFEPNQALWQSERDPFRLEFFHRGYLYRDEVRIHLLDGGHAKPVRFDRKYFQYRGPLADLAVPDDLGFAGVRVLGKLSGAKNFQEIISFLGASYFRAVAPRQVYGTSARGLAVDVGLPKAEEFPAFREFWIARSEPGADVLTMWALLDGPSVAGAYQFQWRPGEATRCDIRAKLYLRSPVEKLGIAPLTSMWAWGDGESKPTHDERPKVHDADGLLIESGAGGWIWRPLSRQTYPSVSRYDLAEVRGFGLMQRDRDPRHYRDDEAKYAVRPSVWIEPRTAWSHGAVELLELPGEHEGIDNIAVWWTPSGLPEPLQPLDLEYAVVFSGAEPAHAQRSRAVTFRLERAVGKPISFEVDFQNVAGAVTDEPPWVPEVQCQRGTVADVRGQAVSHGIYRLNFTVRPAGEQPVELIAVVKRGPKIVSETWRYLCRP